MSTSETGAEADHAESAGADEPAEPDASGAARPHASGVAQPHAEGPGHTHYDDAAELTPLAEYRQALLSRVDPLEPIPLAILEARGSILAEEVVATADVPAFANSAMDGFAVRAGDATPGASLTVVGEVAAGSEGSAVVGSGQAVRIMTGAALPAGADAVVPLEVAVEDGSSLSVAATVSAGDNVRAAGEDVGAGERVLEPGYHLDAAAVGMLAALGRAQVLAFPRPRVAVLSTGDELVDPGSPLGAGQIYDANSHALVALAREAGASAFRRRVVGDDRAALSEAIEAALSQADVLVTSGGVSAGRYDYVADVLGQLGDVTERKVGMKPGMPQAFGLIRGVPCFALPGNPVSAYVSFEVFVRPALRRLAGHTDLNRPRVGAVLDEAVSSPDSKVSFLRVTLRREEGQWRAALTGDQGSAILRSLVAGDGLAEVGATTTSVAAGERVLVHLLEREP